VCCIRLSDTFAVGFFSSWVKQSACYLPVWYTIIAQKEFTYSNHSRSPKLIWYWTYAATMAVIPRHRSVECKTIDGTTISAWLYEVDGLAPAIIMSHGVGSLTSTPSRWQERVWTATRLGTNGTLSSTASRRWRSPKWPRASTRWATTSSSTTRAAWAAAEAPRATWSTRCRWPRTCPVSDSTSQDTKRRGAHIVLSSSRHLHLRHAPSLRRRLQDHLLGPLRRRRHQRLRRGRGPPPQGRGDGMPPLPLRAAAQARRRLRPSHSRPRLPAAWQLAPRTQSLYTSGRQSDRHDGSRRSRRTRVLRLDASGERKRRGGVSRSDCAADVSEAGAFPAGGAFGSDSGFRDDGGARAGKYFGPGGATSRVSKGDGASIEAAPCTGEGAHGCCYGGKRGGIGKVVKRVYSLGVGGVGRRRGFIWEE